jgi:predicted ATPase/transcriptional regulator with XRE-family HTH domain
VTAPFPRWLKEKRRALDLTQLELAERTGCSPETIRKIEAGALRPSRQIAELLARIFDVPQDEHTAFVRFARAASTEHLPVGKLEGLKVEKLEGYQPSNLPTFQPSNPDHSVLGSPWRALHARYTNMPAPTTALVGREAELAGVRDLLLRERPRLVTLTGPPGIGKTRLALEAAAQVAGHFEDGVFFVSLAPIANPELVSVSIAHALGLLDTESQSISHRLGEHLSSKRALLVLDNFEQVVEAAPLVAVLLAASPWLKVLVTSREALHVRGERRFPVLPLGLPDPSGVSTPGDLALSPAVALFVERAREAGPGFALTSLLSDANAPALAAICRRLDGIPLAIELAAARTRLFSPQEILERLEGEVQGSPLQLLVGGARDLPARHQTLRDAIAWSYGLLAEGEQTLYARLGVFVGGFTLSAAEAVCNAHADLPLPVPEGLESLLEKSLLQIRNAEFGIRSIPSQAPQHESAIPHSAFRIPHWDERRLAMLETIRQYALERLEQSGEAENTRRLHAEYYLALAEATEPGLRGSEQVVSLERLERDHDNLRAALSWASRSGEAGLGLRLAGALGSFWLRRGYWSEGRQRLAEALANAEFRLEGLKVEKLESYQPSNLQTFKPSNQSMHLAKALYAAGRLADHQSDYAASRAFYEQALSIYRELEDREGAANSLHGLATLASQAPRTPDDYALARSLYGESLSIRRNLGDSAGIANSLYGLGRQVLDHGEYGSARSLFEEGLAINRALGNKGGICAMLVSLGEVARCRGDYQSASPLYEESLALFRELGDKLGIASQLHNLGHVARHGGDPERAARLFTESLALCRELGTMKGLASCLAGLAGVAIDTGEPERAATLLAAESTLRTIGAQLFTADRIEYDRNLALAHSGLSEARFESAWSAGASMTVEQAVAAALR